MESLYVNNLFPIQSQVEFEYSYCTAFVSFRWDHPESLPNSKFLVHQVPPYDFGYGVTDENNPINDYPDEDDFGDGVAADSSDDGEGSGDFDPFASDNEEYDTVAFDIEEQLRWSRRR